MDNIFEIMSLSDSEYEEITGRISYNDQTKDNVPDNIEMDFLIFQNIIRIECNEIQESTSRQLAMLIRHAEYKALSCRLSQEAYGLHSVLLDSRADVNSYLRMARGLDHPRDD